MDFKLANKIISLKKQGLTDDPSVEATLCYSLDIDIERAYITSVVFTVGKNMSADNFEKVKDNTKKIVDKVMEMYSARDTKLEFIVIEFLMMLAEMDFNELAFDLPNEMTLEEFYEEAI